MATRGKGRVSALPLFNFNKSETSFKQRLNSLDRKDTQYRCPEESAGRGRPKFVIPINQLVGLRSLNFSGKEIAKMLGVSEKTKEQSGGKFSTIHTVS